MFCCKLPWVAKPGVQGSDRRWRNRPQMAQGTEPRWSGVRGSASLEEPRATGQDGGTSVNLTKICYVAPLYEQSTNAEQTMSRAIPNSGEIIGGRF